MTNTETPPCPWCGMIHGKLCPFIRAMDFYPTGEVRRIEFHWDDGGIGPLSMPERLNMSRATAGLPAFTIGEGEGLDDDGEVVTPLPASFGLRPEA